MGANGLWLAQGWEKEEEGEGSSGSSHGDDPWLDDWLGVVCGWEYREAF